MDDESGHTVYDDEVVKIWDGSFRRKFMYETRQPQEFVKARNDPAPLKDIRAAQKLAVPINVQSVFVGNTAVLTASGPASHLFDPGVGDMVIGTTLVVR